jgi:hypothetical protein
VTTPWCSFIDGDLTISGSVGADELEVEEEDEESTAVELELPA